MYELRKKDYFYTARKSFLLSTISVTFEGTGSIMTSRKIVELEIFEYKFGIENTERN